MFAAAAHPYTQALLSALLKPGVTGGRFERIVLLAPSRENVVLKLWAFAALQSPRVHPYTRHAIMLIIKHPYRAIRAMSCRRPNSAAIPLPAGSPNGTQSVDL